ncbi:MAG: PIG-L deacetylase family protein, partial [Candidatus Undinarchaeales archaeon]|nr:PIG-L deacetylase family protein [Candidatus Undinarchaeales archaeon]
CGGAIAKHTQAGDKVTLLILGKSGTSREGEDTSNELRECAKKAAEILGINDIIFTDLPDQKFDTIPLVDIIKPVSDAIEKSGAEIVYTHYENDLNRDHKLAFEATMIAARPQSNVKKILSYEVPSSTEWVSSENVFKPNHFVDITANLDKKLSAMEQYSGELREFPNPRSLEYLKILAGYHGATVNVKAAEAFILIRGIK